MRFERYVPGAKQLKRVYWDIKINEFGGVDVIPVDEIGEPVLTRDHAIVSISPRGVLVRPPQEVSELERLGIKVVAQALDLFSVGELGVIATATEAEDEVEDY